MLARLARDRDADALHQLGQFFGVSFLLGFELQELHALLLDPFAVLRCGRDGHFLGQKVVAAEAVGYLDELPARSELFDVL